jgi:dTDP-4-dehydrorhamnose 3,5-epimerase-like enzyme
MHHSIIQLNPINGMILKIPPGVGHAFLALENDTIINYIINGDFKSEMEFSINPFANAFAIDWPINGHVIISEKDSTKKDLSDLIDLINFIPNP